MIEDNVIKFGYGDILVKSSFNSLIFEYVKEPMEIGNLYKSSDLSILNKVSISFETYAEYLCFKSLLTSVLENRSYAYYSHLKITQFLKKEDVIFQFKGYTFDFTKWNRESILSCLKKLKEIDSVFLGPLAC